MTRIQKTIGVFLIAMFGLWGCARVPADSAVSNDRLKALEAKVAKLDEDLKTALVAKDQLRKKLGEAQDTVDQLQGVVKERDELLKTRTTQRDQVQAKYEGFLKDIEELAGRAKTALQENKPTNTRIVSGGQTGPALPSGGGS